MALPSRQYFTNAIVGQMMAGADVNIYKIDTTAQYPVGQGFIRGDGNIYRYASFDAAVNSGSLVAPVFANSGKATTDNVVVAPASAVIVEAERPILPGQTGSHFVEVTLASIAANQYQGGYLTIEDGSGKGRIYRIKGNTATDNPASGNIRIQLYEPLQATLSPNTDITIVPSMFNDVDVASSATNWACAGVVQNTTTAGSFGWVCTHGVTACLQDGTIAGGDPVQLSRVTSGSVSIWGGGGTGFSSFTGEQLVGYCVQPGATGEFATIFLELE